MTTSPFDSFRPPEPARRERRRNRPGGPGEGRQRGGWLTNRGGRGEQPVVPDVEFTSYYGRNIVKPAPWGWEIPAYLFLGGLAAGSGILGAGAHLTGRATLRRNTRLTAMTAVALSGATLVADLGKPSRFLNMLRTVKLTSPMSVGTWILSGFAGFTGLVTVAEVDRLIGHRLPFQRVLGLAETPASIGSALFGPPLAAYTAVLLGDTATPTWQATRFDLPFVFVGSAAIASGGMAMVTTPTAQAGPARVFALLGACADLAATHRIETMPTEEVEPLSQGRAGTRLRASKLLVVAGAAGAALSGRNRVASALSGAALVAASALTRFAIYDAGIASAKDPRYTVVPQKRRLAERRAAGRTGDSITTAR